MIVYNIDKISNRIRPNQIEVALGNTTSNSIFISHSLLSLFDSK